MLFHYWRASPTKFSNSIFSFPLYVGRWPSTNSSCLQTQCSLCTKWHPQEQNEWPQSKALLNWYSVSNSDWQQRLNQSATQRSFPDMFPQTPEVYRHQSFMNWKCKLHGQWYHKDFCSSALPLCLFTLCKVLLHPEDEFSSLIHYRKKVPEGCLCKDPSAAIQESLHSPGLFNFCFVSIFFYTSCN